MITLKESILGNTRERVLNTKDMIDKFGSLFDIYSFGIYTSGINFVAAGYVDENKLNSLTKDMSYINLDDTQSYKRLIGILNNPQQDYDRDNRPYFDVLLKILMWIENLPCLDFNTMREFEQGLPTWLSNAFKQITKKKIVVQMANFYNDIILSIEWKKGRGTDILFNIKIDKQKAKEYFASMNESILTKTSNKVAVAVQDIKDMQYLGGLYKPSKITMGMKSNNGIGVLNLKRLKELNKGKNMMSDTTILDCGDERMFELVKYMENIDLCELGFPAFDCEAPGHPYYDLVTDMGEKMKEDGIFNRPDCVRISAFQGYKYKDEFWIIIRRKSKPEGICVIFKKKDK